MLDIKVKEHQSLFDIAIQECGSVEAAYELAVMNGLSVTDDLVTGETLNQASVLNADVAAYYKNKGLQPATAITVLAELVASTVDHYISYDSIVQSDEVIVMDNQDFFDLAVIYCGSADAAYDFALLNEMSVSAEITAGTKLKKPAVVNTKIQSYYKTKGLQPATGSTISGGTGGGGETPTGEQGIGYWAIEVDFIVS
jgi:hypothetical protein